jgi:hypothetical protein
MEKRKTMIERQALIATALSAAAVTPKVEICGGCHLPWIGGRDGSMHCATDGCQVFEWWREDQASDHLCGWCNKPWCYEAKGTRYCETAECPEHEYALFFHRRGIPFGAVLAVRHRASGSNLTLDTLGRLGSGKAIQKGHEHCKMPVTGTARRVALPECVLG